VVAYLIGFVLACTIERRDNARASPGWRARAEGRRTWPRDAGLAFRRTACEGASDTV